MKLSCQEIIQLHKRLDGDRRQWLNTWEEIAFYFHPARVGFLTIRARGEKKTERLFDSTGMTALDDLAHYLAAVLVPSASPWFKLKLDNAELNKAKPVREWLEECEKIQRKAINRSNFAGSVIEYFKDLCGFGTAAFECLPCYDLFEEFDCLTFDAPHLREMVGMENPKGEIDLTIRKIKKPAKYWQQKFGELLRDQNIWHDKETKEYIFLHAVFPRDADDIEARSLSGGDAFGDQLPYASVWINLTEKVEVERQGFYERPRTLARWDKNTDNDEGHGPGLRALPDVRTLNEAVRLEFDWWEKQIDPPLKTTEDNITGNLNRAAGEVTVVQRMDELSPLLDHLTAGGWQLQTVQRERLEQNIRDVMFSDLIREPTQNVGTKSQFEVAKRIERAQRILGQAIGRQRWEFLNWVVERSFSVLLHENQFPPMPAELKGQDFEIVPTSPLALAQQAQGLENIIGALQDIALVASIRSPENPGQDPAWDWFDGDGYIKEVFERRNVPATMIQSDSKVAGIRNERSQKQQASEAMAAGQGLADMAETMSKADPAALELIQGGGG